MDITPYVGTIATIVIAFLAFYAALISRLTRIETKMDDLTATVEKHNSVIERMYKVETEMATVWKRIDELKKTDEVLENKKADK